MARSTIQVGILTTGASKAQSDLNSVAAATKRLGIDSETSAVRSTAALSRMGGGLDSLGKKFGTLGTVNPMLGQLSTGLSTMGNRLADVETVGASSATTMTRLGAGANVATAALTLLAAVGLRDFLGATANVREFQRASGATAEDASKLVFVSHELGIESSIVARGVFLLSQALRAGKADLAGYGINVAHAKDGSVDLTGTLINVADVYSHLSNQTDRLNLLTDLFGKRFGLQLAPLLGRGREGIKELADEAQRLGLVFDQEQLDKGKQLSLALREAGAAAEGLAIGVGQGAAPAITVLAHAISGVLGVMNRFQILGTALVGLIAGRLAAALVSLAATGVNRLAEGLGVMGPAVAQLGSGIARLAVPVGIAVAGFTALWQIGQSQIAKDALVNLRELVTLTDKPLANRFALGLASGDPIFKAVRNQFKQVAEQDPALAGRIITALRAAGYNVKAYEDILNDAGRASIQLADDQQANADAIDQTGNSASGASTKIDQLTNSFTGLNNQLAASDAARSYSDELKKLGDLLSPFNSGEAEHAKRVDDLTRATQDSARATRSRQQAERDLAAVRAEDINLLRDQAQLELDQANLRVGTSAREAGQAADHVARLRAAGRSQQEIDAAQDDATAKSIAARQAVQDQAKARTDLANVGPDHEARLADATDRVTQAKQAEQDAQLKVTDAYLKAIQPAADLGTTTGVIADEVGRLIKAAEDLAKAQFDQGLLTANQAALSLAQNLATIASLYPQVAPQIKPIIDTIVNSVRVGQENRPALGAIPANRAYGGDVGSHRWYWVGEQGPELMRLSGGSSGRVYSHHQSMSMRMGSTPIRPMAAGGYLGGETVRVVTIPQQIIGNRIENAHFARHDDMTASGRREGLKGAVFARG